jgi:hypothetical protein
MTYTDATGMDPLEFTSVLTAAALRLRALIIDEIGGRPEVYQEIVQHKDSDDPSLAAMRELVANIENGKDIRPIFQKITQLIHNQESRAEVFNSLSQTHDFGRYVEFLSGRKRIEKVLLAIAEKGELSPGDGLALLEYFNLHIGQIEKKTVSNSTTGRDIASLLSKIDFMVSTQQSQMQQRMAKTTPQNREIMRRVAHKLLKGASASVPK